jgi:TolB-like protein
MAAGSGKMLLALSLMIVPFIATVIYERAQVRSGPEISSIAVVMPIFHGATADDALTADLQKKLVGELTAIPGLQVQKADGIDLMKIGKDLGVDAVLAASLTEDSGVLQIAVRVVDSHTGESLWDKPYEGPRDHYSEIANAVGQTLRDNLHFK